MEIMLFLWFEHVRQNPTPAMPQGGTTNASNAYRLVVVKLGSRTSHAESWSPKVDVTICNLWVHHPPVWTARVPVSSVLLVLELVVRLEFATRVGVPFRMEVRFLLTSSTSTRTVGSTVCSFLSMRSDIFQDCGGVACANKEIIEADPELWCEAVGFQTLILDPMGL